MNFIELSTSYSYIYSPKSWLHFQNRKIKISIISLALACLPFASTQYILISFAIMLCVYTSINKSKYFKGYLYKSIMVCTFLLLINIKNYTKSKVNEIKDRHVLKVSLFSIFSKNNIGKISSLKNDCLYMPTSIIRFTVIYILYLVSTRCLLFTTQYTIITEVSLKALKSVENYTSTSFSFTSTISAQFLKVIFEQIDTMHTSYILRKGCLNKKKDFKENCNIAIFFLDELFANLNYGIHSTSATLYCRDIECNGLYGNK